MVGGFVYSVIQVPPGGRTGLRRAGSLGRGLFCLPTGITYTRRACLFVDQVNGTGAKAGRVTGGSLCHSLVAA